MKRTTSILSLLALLLLFTCPAMTQAMLLDDFNRADSTDMGPNWTERDGDFYIENNQARSSGAVWSRMTYNGATSNEIYVDTFYDTDPDRVQFTALILGYSDLANHLLVKVQDNSTAGDYNSYFFYYGQSLFSVYYAFYTFAF